jgi:hypothetical protein
MDGLHERLDGFLIVGGGHRSWSVTWDPRRVRRGSSAQYPSVL